MKYHAFWLKQSRFQRQRSCTKRLLRKRCGRMSCEISHCGYNAIRSTPERAALDNYRGCYILYGKLFKQDRLTRETQFPSFAWYSFAVKGELLPILLALNSPPNVRGGALVFGQGSPIINTHIPAHVSLCERWLLDEALVAFLPESGNIVRLMRRYAKSHFPQGILPPTRLCV